MTEAEQRRLIAELAPKMQHDANNMLTVMLSTVELMRHGTTPGDPTARRLDRIEAASRQLEGLLRGFLTLARAQQGEADVATLLHRLQPALRLGMAGAARLAVEAPPSGVTVPCDTAGFTAALANAVRGAEEAVLRLTPEGVVAEVPGQAAIQVGFSG